VQKKRKSYIYLCETNFKRPVDHYREQYCINPCSSFHCVLHSDMMTSLSDYTQLVSAAVVDDVEMVRHLLARGLDVNANLDNDIGWKIH